MADVLQASIRQGLGTSQTRRLRKQGKTPAVLYGHGLENVNLSLDSSQLEAAIRHGSKLISIQGDVSDSALIKEVQWDAFGTEVLHVDLTRVSAEESVDVVVAVELVGEAPGSKQGGIVDHSNHEVEIRCPAGALPDKFEVKINDLHIGQSIVAGDIELPTGASLLSEPEAVIVSCVEPKVAEEEEEEAAPAETAEPEIIGRKEEEGEE